MASNSNQRGAIPEEDREKYEVSTYDVLKAMGRDVLEAVVPGYEEAKEVKQKSPKADRERRNR